MAQTTDGLSFIAARAFVSPDGSTWTDLSGFGVSIAVSGGSRGAGEKNTFDGDTPIVTAGKRSSIDLVVRFVYTEEASDPFEVLRAQYETAGGLLYAQYTPKEPGGFWFSTGAGVMQELEYPQGESDSADPVLSEFTVKCAKLTKATAST